MKPKKTSKHNAAKYLGEYYPMLGEIKRLQKERLRFMLQNSPRNKLTSVYDSEGGTAAPSHDSTIKTLADINRCRQLIAIKLSALENILDALERMETDERLALIMRYVDGHSVKVICNTLNYSSRQSVYNLLDSADTKFSQNLGINA